MKCTRCRAVAAVALPSHNSGFCETCFQDFFLRQVERGIKSQKLFEPDDNILVAISGGKDSLSLFLVLSELGYKVSGLHIDLAIPKSSALARKAVEVFCRQHNLNLRVLEMAAENLPLPEVKAKLRRPICSVCGKIKRHYFNKIALEGKFDVLATGHNLDDEVARLFSNTLRWDVAYLADQGPVLEGKSGFVRKVKPLWRLTEFEIANYAFLRGIENHYAPCPYSKGATFTRYKYLWQDIEQGMPGKKIDFYQGFLERGRELFAVKEAKDGARISACSLCGSPSSQEICGVCRIRQTLAE